MSNVNNIVAIPMGDAAGIGPEITVKSLANEGIYDVCQPLVIGSAKVLQKAIEVTNVPLKLNIVSSPVDGNYTFGTIDLLDLDNINIEQLQPGVVQAQCGLAAFEYVKKSIELAMVKEVKSIATTPINKESLKAAGVEYIGHTEMLEDLANSRDPLTMFQVNSLRIFFLTRHVSLKQAISQMTKERVVDYVIRCHETLKRLGIESPKLAVAGLNPHSGEGGLFGMEEVEEIRPGIETAIKEGYNVAGPVPADSVFFQALNGKYDAVLSLYHDQGHIAAKMTDFHRTISITNGLPFLRTSVDHGTAFDIAWKNIASSVSMEECIKLAAEYGSKF
ncbi:4-hydroxythreonine-4-phosphate dehydrogenase PdxA [Ureibacillus sp. NPDC094379]